MKVHYLIESEQESAEREAVMDCTLYRGLTDTLDTAEIIRMPIRTDRRPLNSSYLAQIVFNAMFELEYGIKDIRSRTMFCTTDLSDAKWYSQESASIRGGAVARVFPLKTSKIAYKPGSPDSLDLVTVLGTTFGGMITNAGRLDPDRTKEGAYGDLRQSTHNSDVTNCLDQINSIMAKLKALIGQNEKILAFVDVEFTRCKEVIKGYEIKPASALSSIESEELEIMVFDAPYYYAKNYYK